MKRSCKNLILCFTIAILISMISMTQLWASPEMFRVISTGRNYTEIEFNLSDYEFIPAEVDGTVYQRLYHPESGFLMEEGLPEVLTFSVILAVPETGTVELEAPYDVDSKLITNIQLFPSQGFDFEISEEFGFLIDRAFYEKDVNYPGYEAQVTNPAVMRDMRLVSVTLFPFSYNPAIRELTIRNRMTVRVNYNPDLPGENEITRAPRLFSRSFERLYQGSVLNYSQFRDRELEYQARSILVVHNSNATIVNLVNEFVNWKRSKGFEVTSITTANYSSNNAIKNYIQNAYNTWENPPEYIVIIGGASGSLPVPAWNTNGGWGDHPYTLLEGNDDLADAFVGRIAVDSSTQLATIWNKITNYERTPYLGATDWYERALLVGDPSSSGVSCVITNRYLKEIMLRYNSNYSFVEVYSSPFASQMNSGVNQGVNTFNYRGYIGMSSWSPSDASLNNGLKLPNCAFITCSTLSYISSTSNTDVMVRMGTPTTAKGGITAIGMTTSSTKTAFNNCLGGGIYYGIYVEGMRTMGEGLARGQLYLWQVYGNTHPSQPPQFSQWANLIGDPSMDIWIEQPKPITVSYDTILPLGSNSIVINVIDAQGNPLPEAWVTIRQGADVVFDTNYTDDSGNVTLFFNPISSGIVSVTVTKPDYIPHLGNINISGNPGVTYHNSVVNGDIVAGTNVNFALLVKNHSSQTVNNVTGVISTESDYVSITTASSSFGNIAAGAVVESITDYTINIAPDTPSNHKAIFLLTTTDALNAQWQSRFTFTVLNGNLVPQSIVINDGGNGILEPGEQANIMVHLNNSGATNLQDIYGIIRGGGQGLSIIDSVAYFGNINSGQTGTSTTQHFLVSAASYVIPGMSFNLELYLYNNQGYEQTRTIHLSVGQQTVNDPLGPDAYGYWCYDWGDTAYLDAPVYDWIEIYPGLGGSGINTNLTSDHNNNQNVMNMNLPFTFKFYGVEYNQISICANGWVAMGVTAQATFRNFRLPGPLGPSSIIAAFWDNLAVSTATGGVYTYYDTTQHIFIIQWQNAQNIVGNAIETFQIILYNPMYYFTTTGDGPIKIQYKTFNNVNNGTGYPYGNWGNYATIGIADHTCTVGLEYSFGNQYPTAARPLSHEKAIYFTTGSVDYDNAFVAIDTFSVSDDNNNIPEFGETVGLNMTLVNLGAQTAENVSAILNTSDTYITIIDNSAQFGNLDEEETATVNNAFSFEIADNIPHMHRVSFILQISATGDLSWNHYFNLDINAPELVTLQPLIYDPLPGGNDNGLIDPGETLIMYLPIQNSGGSDAPPVTLNITSSHPMVTINSISDDSFYSVSAGDIMYPALNLSVNSNINIGTEIAFNYTFQTGNYTFTGTAYTNVGGMVTAQMGSGTSSNTNTDGSPINIWYRSLRGQMVYTATELNAAGINGAGSIVQFGFYVTSPPIHALPNFIIRMKHTTANNAAAHDNGPFTTVYTTPSYLPVAGNWNMMTLTTPFAWNGVDNILVDTAFAQVPNYNSSGQLRVYNVNNGYRFVRADGSDQTNSTTTTTSSNKPQAMIVLVTSTGAGGVTRPENLTAQYVNSQIHLQWQPPTEPDRIERSTTTSDRVRSSDKISIRNTEKDNLNYRDPLGYNVYRNGYQINSNLVAVTEFFDAAVEPLMNYYYFVTAVFTDGESSPSNIVSVELANRVATPEFTPPAGYYNTAQNISIATVTEDALVYYTFDGSEPDENSTLYDLPINLQMGTNIILKAKGYRTDLLPSETGIAEYHITQTIPMPAFSPEPGVYLGAQEISISLPNNEWNIYYTLDGSVPTETSNLYTGPFMINVSSTVRARGFATNWLPSETSTGYYDILNAPQDLTASASYGEITLEWEEPLMSTRRMSAVNQRTRNNRNRDDNRETLIGYNVFRSMGNPNNMTLLNTNPVTETTYTDSDLNPGSYYYVVRAVFSEGISNPSNMANTEILRVATPVITPAGGNYYQSITVNITCQTTGAALYYTLDGTEPTTDDILYVSPFEINYHAELRVRGFKEDWISSQITTTQYYFLYAPQNLSAEGHIGFVVLNWEEPWSSDNRNPSGTRTRNNMLRDNTMSSRTLLGYNVYRAFENGNPVQINTYPIPETTFVDHDLVPGTYHYSATALYQQGESLPSNTVTLNIGGTVANPQFSPEPGDYDDPIDVIITCVTLNASIYYTTDGSDPDENSLLYQTPIHLNQTTTIKAIATLPEWDSSEIITALYTIGSSSSDEVVLPIVKTELLDAYPNPFNPSTTISFTLREPGYVTLEIYNIAGKKVSTLVKDYLNSGKHTLKWDGIDDQGKKLGSGIYLYRMNTKDYQAIKKLVLLK